MVENPEMLGPTAGRLLPARHKEHSGHTSGAVCSLLGVAPRGHGTVRKGCTGPQKLQKTKAQGLGTLPLSDMEKVGALVTFEWAGKSGSRALVG